MTATITDLSARRHGYRLNDTPTRWHKALQRAIAEGVTVRQLATTGVWIATSGTDAGTAYVVTPTDCECRAAQEGDVCCKHRAMLRHRLATPSPNPDPTPPAPAPAKPRRTAVVEVLDSTGRLAYRSDELAKRAA